jgi:hypothetical protein
MGGMKRDSKKKKRRGPSTTVVGPMSEWADFSGIQLLFGLRRTTTWHLCNSEPALRDASISLRGENEVRGKRLFNVAKFRAFLESRIT